MGIKENLLSLDIFGSAYELNFKGNARLNSSFGSIVSLLIYIVFSVYMVDKFVVFILKDDFTVSSYDILDIEGGKERHNLFKDGGGMIIQVN